MLNRRGRPALLLVGLGAVLALPYWLSGPGWFREDFESLWRASVDGAWSAGGPVVGRNRPGAAVVYAVEFGLLGDRPGAAFGLVVALAVVNAVLLFALVRLWLDPPAALGATAVFLALPANSALNHWASTANVRVALCGLLAALLLTAKGKSTTAAALAAAVGVLTYEAIFPALLVGAALLSIGDDAAGARRRAALGSAGAATAAAGWVWATSSNSEVHLLRAAAAVRSNFGLGFAGPLGVVLASFVITAASVSVYRWVRAGIRDRDWTGAGRVVGSGLAVVAVGLSPFILFGFGMDFSGQGDRANFLSTAGMALILVGLGQELAARTPPFVLVGAVSALAVAIGAARFDQAQDWAETWDRTRQALHQAESESGSPDPVVFIADCPIVVGGVQGIHTDWDATLALQWWTADPNARAECGSAASGSLPSVPDAVP